MLTTSNAKQLGLSLIMYANDYDGVFPYAPDSETAEALTYPYTKSHWIWVSGNPNGGQLMFNTEMGGVNGSKLKDPDKALLVFDSKPWANGSRTVCYADGHAKTITASQWAELEKYRKSLRLIHVGKPLKHLHIHF